MTDISSWTPLIAAASTLMGVVITFLFTARNLRLSREHDRLMRREEWEHARILGERQKRRDLYEQFLASIDSIERAISMMYSARQSGKVVDDDPEIRAAVFKAMERLYEARSLLTLYASPPVESTGIALSTHVLEIERAYRDFDHWKRELYERKGQFVSAVRNALGEPSKGAESALHDAAREELSPQASTGYRAPAA